MVRKALQNDLPKDTDQTGCVQLTGEINCKSKPPLLRITQPLALPPSLAPAFKSLDCQQELSR